MREPQPAEQFVRAALPLGHRRAGQPGAELELGPHGGPQELVLGLLEDRPHAGHELPAAPLERVGARAAVEDRVGPHGAAHGGEQTRQRQRERGLAGAVGPGQRERAAAAQGQLHAGHRRGEVPARGGVVHRAAAAPRPPPGPQLPRRGLAARDAQTGGAQQRCAVRPGAGGPGSGGTPGGTGTGACTGTRGGASGRTRGRHPAGHPHPRAAELVGRGAEHPARRAVVGDAPVPAEHDDAVHDLGPHGDTVLHDHERGAAAVEAGHHRVADLPHAGGVQVGGRLVEQQQPGAHGHGARERQALLLPAGQGRGGVVEGEVQPHVLERRAHPRPDLLPGHREVLEAEGGVVPDPGQHHLGLGVLLHETGAAARLLRRHAVEQQLAGGGLPVVVVEDSRQGVQEGGLARPAGSQQEHALPRLHHEVEAAQRRRVPPGVVPAEAAGLDPRPAAGGHHGALGRESRHRRTARPDARPCSTPVAARARTTACISRPASTAPETAARTT